MRLFCLLLLIGFVAVVTLFAMQNNEPVTLQFFQYSMTVSLAELIGAMYVFGMVSGWTVVGILRRSLVRVTEFPAQARSTW